MEERRERQHQRRCAVYFAGHGMRSKGDSVMLMEDFGDDVGGTLDKAVSSRNLYDGMANSVARPNMARTQLFFIDACRVMPSEFKEKELMTVPVVWDVDLGVADLRKAPIFYAGRSGKLGGGVAGLGTLFGLALLGCLDNDAAELDDGAVVASWRITIFSLNRAMRTSLERLNTKYKWDQEFVMDGDSGDATLRVFPAAPLARVSLEVIPGLAAVWAQVTLFDENGAPVLQLPKPFVPN